MNPSKELRLKIRINRAIINMKLENINEAKVALEDINSNIRTKKIYQTLGYLYVITNDKKAESYNLEAYDYDNEDSIILDNLTQYYISNKDFKKARIYGEKAYEENSSSVDILHHLALIEEHDKNMEKAKEYAQDMINAKITALSDITKEQRDKVFKRIMGKD